AGRVGRSADLRVLLGPDGEDGRDRRDRLDVVDQRRRRIHPRDRRERGLRPRLAALALERFEERRLFAADVGAGAAVDHDLDAAQQAGLPRLVERRLEHLVLLRILAADVDEDVLRLDRVRRDEAALEQPVRDLEHDLAVLERPRLGLVGADRDVDRLGDLVGRRDEARLAARREEGAAAATEVRLDELLDDRLRILRPGLLELVVAAHGAIRGQGAQRLALVAAEDEGGAFGDLNGGLTHRAAPPRLPGRPPASPTGDSGGR